MIKVPKVFSFDELDFSEDLLSDEMFMESQMRKADEKTLFIAS